MFKVLILATSHGAAHLRASKAVRGAFFDLCPEINVTIMDAIAQCAPWFRAYYDSYEIPLRYWPGLWRRIERRQHQQPSTNPTWLYRLGAKPLFNKIRALDPDVVVASEVGVCELAALHKHRARARYFLTALELMDFNRGWIRAEVDLYAVVHPDLGAELEGAGAPNERVAVCGMPIDPAFAQIPEKASARERLGLRRDLPVVLVLFGGTGFGSPRRIAAELGRVGLPIQAVFIGGNNPGLRAELEKVCAGADGWRTLGWVDNMHEWMAAADMVLSKPGGSTLMESCACGLPFLAFDPLPGNEERTCRWIEKWGAGVWVKTAVEISSSVRRLLDKPEELAELERLARAIAHPHAARDTAAAILTRVQPSCRGRRA